MATNPVLGAPGPYMVCAVCNTPLDRFSLVNEDDPAEEDPDSVRYTHSAALTDEDHPPVPVPGTPIEAALICDFCHAPSPKYAFVPRRPIRVAAADGTIRDYSSPWSACADCLGPARKRAMTKLLNRAMNSPYGSRTTSLPTRARPYAPACGSSTTPSSSRHQPDPTRRRSKARPASASAADGEAYRDLP